MTKYYPPKHAFSSDKFVADNLEAADTDESAAAQLSTTLQDQNAPRCTIELANWLARL